MSVQRYLASGKMHLAYSSTNISQVLLNVESTLEIKIVLMTKIGPLTTQEHRWRQLLSVDRQLLIVDRQLLMVDRQLRKCRSTVTKCRLLVKRVTFHVLNGPP